jgi:imidazolonepropionase-like amidohydrolase
LKHVKIRLSFVGLILMASSLVVSASVAQHTPPPDDIRSPEIRRDAIVGVTLVPRPGEVIENATILLRDGMIEAVGTELDVPAGYRVRDLTDHFVYAGLIDPSVVRSPGAALEQARNGAGSHWNSRIVPQIDMRDAMTIDSEGRKSLRAQGFTMAQVLPESGILRGNGAIVLLAERDLDARPLTDRGMMFAALEQGGWGGSSGYPGSKMGAIALLRQTLEEARWHARNQSMFADDPSGMEPPEQSDALDALQDAMNGRQIVIFDASDELDAIRTARIAEEFQLQGVLLGSGMEFRRTDEVAATGLPIITPLNFPKAPDVKDPYAADRVTLRELQTWKHAPSNPRRLLEAGISVALTTHRLDSPGSFHDAVRKSIDAGLKPEEALACVTTRPARLLGIESLVGTVEPGRIANLLVVDGKLFAKGTEVREVWVAGRRSEIKAPTKFMIGGIFDVVVDGTVRENLKATIDPVRNRLTITAENEEPEADAKDKAEGDEGEGEGDEDNDKGDEAAEPANDEPGREDPVSGVWDCVVEIPNMGEIPMTMTFGLTPDDRVTGGITNPMFSAEVNGRFDRAASSIDLTISMEQGPSSNMNLKIAGDTITGTGSGGPGGGSADITGSRLAGMGDGDEASAPKKGKRGGLRNTKLTRRNLGFASDGEMFGLEGDVIATAVVINDRVVGSLQTTSGKFVPFELKTRPEPEDAEDATTNGEDDPPKNGEDATKPEEDAESEDPETAIATIERLPTPLGMYGRLDSPRPRPVVIRNATIWTCADTGVLQDADLLVRDGKIVAVGHDLVTNDDDILEIDGTGMHVTPGLIDCHSHTGISGGVNEGAQTNTAEVRIGDVIDPDDINLFRQLAGGLTAANQLHGSANPIGGQNSVVKLRWGGTVDDMRFEGAKPGIKFALGENVKRGGGYPNTRMGVAAFIEDAFQAAREYDAAGDRFLALPPEEQARQSPPRPDFELDTIVEILDGDRIIHCHSYRQDEILMLLRLCERYNVRIGTLQHILEGYKVADEIAAHGAGASSFSDWWAYKMEVMDAIPYNGSLMHEVGVVVSFNSDDDEVATRMNDEAAKAVRWGGLEPHEALKFVTINPARQLQIDARVGSLEPGKDADFVLWNQPPLSSYARCEETWIDGARYYDREEASNAHASAMAERGQLLAEAGGGGGGDDEKPEAANDSEEQGGRPGGRGARRPGGTRPTGLLARMLQDREEVLLERVARGEDPAAIRAGECGCGSASMIELARTLARDRARLETLGSEEAK